MKDKSTKNKHKIIKYLILGILVFGVGTTSIYLSYTYNKVKHWNEFVYQGVSVEDIDLSGKSKIEASAILKAKYTDGIIKKNIIIKTPSKDYTIGYDKLKATYNIEDAVNEAFEYGKNLSLFNKYKLIKSPENKKIKLKFTSDTTPVNNVIATIEKDVNVEAVNAKITMKKNGEFAVTPEKKGAKLQSETLKNEIISKIDGLLIPKIEVKAVIDEVNPKITAEKLNKINTKIYSFSTNFGTISSPERANNIILSTKSIDGTMLMPGDTFSFNDVVGRRTEEKGYKTAPVIVGNKVESDFGGGICQVSSTLYNAVLRANLKSVERTHHTFPSAYVPIGIDATVDYGNLDYKFQNTLSYPVYIQGTISDGVVSFSIYSDRTLMAKSYDIVSDVYQTLQPTTKTVDDPTLAAGQQVIEQKAYTGYRAKVYLCTYDNGKLISKDLLYEDYYKPIDGLIKKGTKK